VEDAVDQTGTRWRYGLLGLQTLTTASALIGLLRQSLDGALSWLYLVLIGIVAASQVGLHLLSRQRGTRKLIERTEKFNRFFGNWYGQTGDHTIFCKDLHWLEDPKHGPVLNAVLSGGSRVEIFLRSDSSRIRPVLEAAGVKVHLIRAAPTTRITMSLHSVDGTDTLIIRRKVSARGPDEVIQVSELRQPETIALVSDLFTSLRPAPVTPAIAETAS
jgi:hypothetical protein